MGKKFEAASEKGEKGTEYLLEEEPSVDGRAAIRPDI